jgi:hypothetical protein
MAGRRSLKYILYSLAKLEEQKNKVTDATEKKGHVDSAGEVARDCDKRL